MCVVDIPNSNWFPSGLAIDHTRCMLSLSDTNNESLFQPNQVAASSSFRDVSLIRVSMMGKPHKIPRRFLKCQRQRYATRCMGAAVVMSSNGRHQKPLDMGFVGLCIHPVSGSRKDEYSPKPMHKFLTRVETRRGV